MALAAADPAVRVVTGDNALVEEVGDLGGERARRCFQCGTCSVVCPATPDSFPFPRKEMLWVQWGLRDRLLRDPDAWLCYHCNDCATHCPTGARPGDVMAAIRAYQVTSYAVPRFMAKIALHPQYFAFAFVIPVLIVLALVGSAVLYPNDGRFVFPEGRILFADFIPESHIDIATFATMGVVFALAGVGLGRFWRNIQQSPGAAAGPALGVRQSVRSALVEIVTHRTFRDCGASPGGLHVHLAVFYGFLMLVAATVGAAVYTVALPAIGVEWSDGDLSLPLWDPVKVIGNVGGVLLLAGASVAVYVRLARSEEAGGSSSFDWFFIAIIYLTTATGFVLEALRLWGVEEVAYSFYLVHLVFVYTLFTYFPFSKFAHVLYRTIAVFHAYRTGRKVPGARH